MSAFVLEGQSWVVVTETIWPTTFFFFWPLKYLLSVPLQKKRGGEKAGGAVRRLRSHPMERRRQWLYSHWLVAEVGGGQLSACCAKADRICWQIKRGGDGGEHRKESKYSSCFGLNGVLGRSSFMGRVRPKSCWGTFSLKCLLTKPIRSFTYLFIFLCSDFQKNPITSSPSLFHNMNKSHVAKRAITDISLDAKP